MNTIYFKIVFCLSILVLLNVFFWENEAKNSKATINKKQSDAHYKPTWDSLDARPLPKWYDEAKVGIFLHWGVYSVPSFGSEWFWFRWKTSLDQRTSKWKNYGNFMRNNYPKGYAYQDFAKDFTAEFFNPEEWATIFKNSGARYVVLTSKHHEGYTLWPSKYSFNWNAMETGPHRDLIKELSEAVRHKGLRFGLYHSLYEWFNPLYLADKKSNWIASNFVSSKVLPELSELVENYRPEVIWSDGDWEASDTYWQAKEFLTWLYNESSVKDTVVVNDRWGKGTSCHHGGFYTCMDKYNPRFLQPHKWENAMTLDKKSWGFRRNAKLEDYLTTFELLKTLTETISCGGNILINVGPTKDGIIAPIFQQRLSDLGKWLGINGEAIYGSKPWIHQNDINRFTWYTARENAVYAINLRWPEANTLKLHLASSLFNMNTTKVTLLNSKEKLKWSVAVSVVSIFFPDKATIECEWAYVVKIVGFQ